jgi:hypothetical protein
MLLIVLSGLAVNNHPNTFARTYVTQAATVREIPAAKPLHCWEFTNFRLNSEAFDAKNIV